MSLHVLRSNFNNGEISPLMDARVDAEKYQTSCRRLENFIPKVYGGVFRRPGTLYLGAAGDESKAVRLMSLNVSADTRYILEFGELYLRIWNDDGTPFIDKINSPYTNILQLTTPYPASAIFAIQMAQVGNVCYFTHPSYKPQRLIRSINAGFGAVAFTWSAFAASFPAFRDTNDTIVTATASATTGNITISFSANVFVETLDYSRYAGTRIMLSQRRAASHVKLNLTSTADSSSVVILGDYNVYTYGSYTGTLSVQEKDSAGAWKTTRSFQATSDRQIAYSSATDSAVEVRLSYSHTSGTGATAYLEAADSRRVGYAVIDTGIQFAAGLPVVNCTVEEDFDSTAATTDWALEAWGGYSGYPRSLAFHEQRLWFGGTELEPNTFWASQTNDFENFRRGANDADSLSFTLAAQEGSAIQSMLSHEALILFTQSEEWTATTSQQTAITPSNIYVRRQSRFGSAHQQAFVANNNIIFLQRGGRKLREFRYSASGADGQSSDLTLLAEHISLTGIVQIGFQQQPDPVMWCVLDGGDLIGLTYESDQNVIAWSKHTTEGEFESVAVIYGDGAADEVWFVVKRGARRFIERFNPDAFSRLETGTISTMVYSDAAEILTADPAQKVFTGLHHLEGSTVSILADGGAEPDQVVTGGTVTLGLAAATVVVGLPFTSLLQPSKIEVGMQDGTAQGRTFLCKRVSLNLWKTFGLQYANIPGAAENEWYPASLTPTELNFNAAATLFTGLVDLNNLGAHGQSVDFSVRQTLPLPCNILGMVPKIEILGN